VNISTPQELYNIRNDLSGKYRLTNDISLSDYSTGWNPIGDAANPFIGCLDGNGFKITYLFVDVTSRYGGLFGYINGGEIGNIGVEADSRGVNASGNISYAGIIAGYVSNDSSITDSYATGDVTATATLVSYAGGLVGYMSGIITNSYATGDVTATTTAPTSASNAGGLVGSMYYGSITDSYAIGDVTATATSNNSIAGGLVGAMEYSSITDSYATGDVTAGRFAGGLVGGMIGSITDSYATGDVTAGRFAGGLVGMMADGSITDSYATGYVTATASYSRAGGLVGEMRNGWIINSVAANLRVEITQGTGYIGRIVGDIYSGGSGTNNFALDAMQAVGGSFDTTPANHGEDKTEAQLKDQSTYETGLGWEFGNRGDPIWKMPSGGGYPILYWQSE
jgi:hypothetical protein